MALRIRNGRPCRAMILAAGLGTRLKPWTDFHPKALAMVNGKSLLQHNVEYLQRFGIDELVVNVHHFSDQIQEAITINNGWGSSITVSDELDNVLETGGGLKKAAQFFDDSPHFVLMNADILTDLPLDQMIDYHINSKALATLATSNRNTSRYFLFNKKNALVGWRNVLTGAEKPASLPAASQDLIQKAFSGIQVLSSEIFKYMPARERFSIVDVYLDLAPTHIIQSFDHSGTKFIDVGKPESIARAEMMFT